MNRRCVNRTCAMQQDSFVGINSNSRSEGRIHDDNRRIASKYGDSNTSSGCSEVVRDQAVDHTRCR